MAVDAVSAILPSLFAAKAAHADECIVSIGGVPYQGWTETSVNFSMQSLAGSFSLAIAEPWQALNAPWPIRPGMPVVVALGVEPVITGWVDSIDVGISNTERTFSISGRCRTADLVDCAAVCPTGEFNALPLVGIANQLCTPFGIAVVSKVPEVPFKKFRVQPGETVFECLSRAAAMQGALLMADALGNLRITNRASEPGFPAASILEEGTNIISGSATYDDSDRFSTYTFIGQYPANDAWWGVAASGPIGVSVDPSVLRYRPYVKVAENSMTPAHAVKRANWEANVRAAKASKFRIRAPGWRKPNGILWQLNDGVPIRAPKLGITGNLVVTGVRFSKSVDGGTVVDLDLSRFDAFLPTPALPANEPKNTLGW